MNDKVKLMTHFFAATLAVAILCVAPIAKAGVISVDFLNNGYEAITRTYGITNQNTVVGGWVNLTQANNSNLLPFSDGTISTVYLAGTSATGWATGNAGYAGTPLQGGKMVTAATTDANRPNVTLANLNANFPNGYKVIVYLSGFLGVSDAYISNGITTFYYRGASSSAEVTSVVAAGLYQTTQTTDLGAGNNPLAQYAVFGNTVLLTNDSMTFTLGGSSVGSGAWIGGFQIVGTAFNEPVARLLTAEGFDASLYTTGVSLFTNATPGYGFDGSWTGYGGQVKILTNSLVYTGYGADGENHVQLTNNAAIRRTFLTGNNGPLGNYLNTNGLISWSEDGTPLYLAFLVYSPTNQSPGGDFSLFVGDYTVSNQFFMVQLNTTNPFPITATIPYNAPPRTLGNNNNAANLVVARFDFAGTNGTVQLWLNPSTSAPEPAPNGTFTNLTIAFDRLQLTHGYASGAVEFDEIRFGNDWSNTVQSAGLATLPGPQPLVGMRGLPPSPLGGTNYPREFFPFVDAFGQYRFSSWTNKVASVANLRQNATNEAADLAANPGPSQWDQYGGWLNGPQLTATGFFRVQKYQGDWWFVDPDGHLFWSQGVTGINAPSVPTGVTSRQNYFATLPNPGDATYKFLLPWKSTSVSGGSAVVGGYYVGGNPLTMDFQAANAFLKYGSNWYAFALNQDQTRLRSWGVNTIGSWTTSATYLSRRTPYAVVLYPYVDCINSDSRMPDYFNPVFATALTNVMSGNIRNDPWCLGFYINNELPWNCTWAFPDEKLVAQTALAANSASYAKAAFQSQLMTKYGTISALNSQWGTSYVSWADFLTQTTVLPSGTSGDADLTAFYQAYAKQFFSTCATVIHGYTSNLFLGCRFSGSFPDAVSACTNYVDVASVKSYASTFSIPTGLEADIPVLNTEYNFCAKDTGLFWGGLRTVASQAERASSFTSHFNSAISNSRVVGAHWFQLLDRSTTGILNSDGDGNNNNGLVDVCDTPYYLMIAAARSAAQVMYAQRLGTTPPAVTAITNVTIHQNTSAGPIAFTIGDDLTSAGSLALSQSSSDTNLVPTSNIVFGGSGASRTVTITPQVGRVGTVTITITVTDGAGLRSLASFNLTVLPNPPALSNYNVNRQQFQFTISGTSSLNYYIQASTNLTNWQTVLTNLNAVPPLIWTDPQTTNFGRRFYRVLVVP